MKIRYFFFLAMSLLYAGNVNAQATWTPAPVVTPPPPPTASIIGSVISSTVGAATSSAASSAFANPASTNPGTMGNKTNVTPSLAPSERIALQTEVQRIDTEIMAIKNEYDSEIKYETNNYVRSKIRDSFSALKKNEVTLRKEFIQKAQNIYGIAKIKSKINATKAKIKDFNDKAGKSFEKYLNCTTTGKCSSSESNSYYSSFYDSYQSGKKENLRLNAIQSKLFRAERKARDLRVYYKQREGRREQARQQLREQGAGLAKQKIELRLSNLQKKRAALQTKLTPAAQPKKPETRVASLGGGGKPKGNKSTPASAKKDTPQSNKAANAASSDKVKLEIIAAPEGANIQPADIADVQVKADESFQALLDGPLDVQPIEPSIKVDSAGFIDPSAGQIKERGGTAVLTTGEDGQLTGVASNEGTAEGWTFNSTDNTEPVVTAAPEAEGPYSVEPPDPFIKVDDAGSTPLSSGPMGERGGTVMFTTDENGQSVLMSNEGGMSPDWAAGEIQTEVQILEGVRKGVAMGKDIVDVGLGVTMAYSGTAFVAGAGYNVVSDGLGTKIDQGLQISILQTKFPNRHDPSHPDHGAYLSSYNDLKNQQSKGTNESRVSTALKVGFSAVGGKKLKVMSKLGKAVSENVFNFAVGKKIDRIVKALNEPSVGKIEYKGIYENTRANSSGGMTQ